MTLSYVTYDPNDTETPSLKTDVTYPYAGGTISATTLTSFNVPYSYTYMPKTRNELFSADTQTYTAGQASRTITLTLYPNNREFSTVADMEAYQYAWEGMIAIVGDTQYKYTNGQWEVYYGFEGKWLVTYEGGTTSSADCSSSSILVKDEINPKTFKSIEIGNCTTQIGDYGFQNYNNLEEIKIGKNVTSIGHEAFMNTNKITTLTIPASVTEIGFWCFTRCTGLTETIFESTTPPTLSVNYQGVFHDYCPPVIYVPHSAVSAYRAIAGNIWTNKTWSSDIIQPISSR